MGQDMLWLSKEIADKRQPVLENIAREVRKLSAAKKSPFKELLAQLDTLVIR